MPEKHLPDRALPPALHEDSDVPFRGMFGLFVLIGSGLLASMLIAWLMFPDEVADRRFNRPFPEFPRPALQVSPPTDMAAFYAQEMQRLNSAGWIDRASGRVHIPIAQAMAIVAKEGIQGWPGKGQETAAGPGRSVAAPSAADLAAQWEASRTKPGPRPAPDVAAPGAGSGQPASGQPSPGQSAAESAPPLSVAGKK